MAKLNAEALPGVPFVKVNGKESPPALRLATAVTVFYKAELPSLIGTEMKIGSIVPPQSRAESRPSGCPRTK